MRADRSAWLPGPRRPPSTGPSAVAGPATGATDATATARTAPGCPRRGARRLGLGWLLTRGLLTVLVLTGQTFGAQQNVQGDLRIYADWAGTLGHGGGLPVGDDRWQYPPGAAVAFVVPELAHTLSMLSYRVAFVVAILLVDAAVTVCLARRARDAAWFWIIGLTALGPVALARFDLLPAAAALTAVLAVARGRAGRAGFALGVGALLKVWPVLLLVALPRPGANPGAWSWVRLRRVLGGVVGAVVAFGVVLAASGWWRDAFGFVGAQQARGLQVEAVAATPFVLVHMAGGPGPRYSYGSLQFDGPWARAVATACSLGEALVIVTAALWWWRRPAPSTTGQATARLLAGRALALVLVVVVTARVLSPQYLVWLLALATAGVAVGGTGDAAGAGAGVEPPGRGRSRLAGFGWCDRFGRVGTGLVAAAATSQLIYPWRYNDVVQGRIVLSVLLVARNLLLIMVCWWALRAAAAAPPPAPFVPPPTRPAPTP
ncbi:glycosyltransferase 87 family protein [Frankia sp. R82]|uniref:glycosyltransferase 87 family protein n=1 Tax=Frankia sp. R82 TaxID=2950553 RepID=UPI002042C11C|nr:glycosyltransferase 87 family protein [Frankia sp. R82]MCM3886402.1 glycosyltransferase 87 family protein [Frankia sp. R82]